MRTFNEQIEKEVGNIIGRNCEKMIFPETEPVWCIKDLPTLMYELLDYMESKDENKKR